MRAKVDTEKGTQGGTEIFFKVWDLLLQEVTFKVTHKE